MAALMQRLRSVRQLGAAVLRTAKQLELANKIKEETIAAQIATEDQKLRPVVRQMLLANYHASGLQNRSGTMERAMQNINVDIGRGNMFISMPIGLKYKNPKSNPYAAAGVFRYGGVRQPRTQTHHKDLPTHEIVKSKKAHGIFGAHVKRQLKKALFKGIIPTGRSKKSLKALMAFGRGEISVVDPRPPFFELTDGQRKTLLDMRLAATIKILKANGIQVG